MPTLGHGHSPADVPTEPSKSVRDRIPKLNPDLLQKLRDVRDCAISRDGADEQIVDQRRVWQRYALLAQFTDVERREIVT